MALPFLTTIEEATRAINVLAAQEEAPIPADISADGAKAVAGRLYENHTRLLAALREQSAKLKGAVGLARELDLAKAPDVERLAEQLFVASHSGGKAMNYRASVELAKSVIAERDNLRTTV